MKFNWTISFRINSRLLRIPFKTIEPRLVGREKTIAELCLKQASKDAYRSVGIVTAYLRQCIITYQDDEKFFEIVNDVKTRCGELSFELDQRVRDMLALLFCCTWKVKHLLKSYRQLALHLYVSSFPADTTCGFKKRYVFKIFTFYTSCKIIWSVN